MKQVPLFIGIIAFLITSTHAAIIYSGTLNQPCNEFSSFVDADFNQDGNLDVRFGWKQISYGSTSTMAFSQDSGFNQALLLRLGPGSIYEPAVLDYNHIIGQETIGGYAWHQPALNALLYTSIDSYPPFSRQHYGRWNNQAEKYLGCEVVIDSVVYYGWIQMSVDAENNVTLVDYAYDNNPNTAIYAGYIPEPASLSLLVLGSLLLPWCKRQ